MPTSKKKPVKSTRAKRPPKPKPRVDPTATPNNHDNAVQEMERKAQMLSMIYSGFTQRAVAQRFNLSEARVSQIVHEDIRAYMASRAQDIESQRAVELRKLEDLEQKTELEYQNGIRHKEKIEERDRVTGEMRVVEVTVDGNWEQRIAALQTREKIMQRRHRIGGMDVVKADLSLNGTLRQVQDMSTEQLASLLSQILGKLQRH